MKPNHQPYRQFCVDKRQQQLLRHLPYSQNFLYDFSHNDYLGLSRHPALINAAMTAAKTQGTGSTASRLVGTQQAALKTLEHDIAQHKKSQAALIFATGFQANLSVISALLDSQVLGHTPLVFSDKLNHASMHAACQLAGVKQMRYRHGDYEHLDYLLNKYASAQQTKFILTESVFGMDGDVTDLATLIKLAKTHQATLYVDEAHATGILGYGLSANFDGEIDIAMGTFSKALGGSGAYVACSRLLKRYFINRASGLIYSTAPSPMQVAAMQAAWDLIPHLQNSAQALLQKASLLRDKLNKLGYDCGQSATHIIPIILKTAHDTLKAQRFLASRGIRVSAIRPPSVPAQQSRLRIALSLSHTNDALDALYAALKDYQAS